MTSVDVSYLHLRARAVSTDFSEPHSESGDLNMNVNLQWFAASASPRTTLRGPDVARIGVGHALIDNCSSEQVCKSIIAHAQNRGKPAYVITPNAQHIVLLEKDRRLQEVYSHADLVIPDGISLIIAARLYGRSLQQRIAGVDVFKVLCGHAAEADLHVFLLGGRPGSAELAAAALRGDYLNLRCTTYCPPLGFEQSADGLKQTADAITAARPDILFVALGAPKQEYWIYEHGLQLSVPVCIGVGGSFEIVGGVVPRAPLWTQSIGWSGSIASAANRAGCGAVISSETWSLRPSFFANGCVAPFSTLLCTLLTKTALLRSSAN